MYIKYKKADGEIASRVEGVGCVRPDDDLIFGYIDGDYDPLTHYVVEGLVQEYTLDAKARKSTRPNHPSRWSNTIMDWIDVTDISASLECALSSIDEAAGIARLRYVTSVPGQAETYAKKEQQAREWTAAGYAGPAPSFIGAEAVALNRSGQTVAEEVIALADFWANVKGPEIESTRLKWKAQARLQSTVAGLNSVIEQARQELNAL